MPASPLPAFEKLGAFYLGKRFDPSAGRTTDDLLLYDSRDLVTHAVCVGMTGSGKTGLCIGLLEEAAIDGIPAIVIDPKGDLTNLLLTFPDLAPADFRPWVNPDDARRKGLDEDAFAKQQAELWAKGLAEWGQAGDRIRRLRAAAEFTVYTPGSTAGIGVSLLKSFDPPPEAILADAELLRERIASTATSLLGLAGGMNDSASDPTSREHILISTLLGDAWARGVSLDLPAIITAIQSPPPALQRIGVMDLETFYPAKERFGLAMALNNLVAAPGFARWLEGQPLDIASFLTTPRGKPRIAIFSIAHLSEAERMFFVAMLLNQTLGWVRTQSGTSSLRALLYMDEIAGYVPPVANPPSKRPLLTLMKQGRAFGFGVVLATQNPVDLDYKGLSNAGTWFIGRLQTERDKARVLDGLEGASSGARFDRAEIDRLLSGLAPRTFLMNNIHEAGPVLFQTRWCLSYLRGPLTREQIKSLQPQAAAEAHASGPLCTAGALCDIPPTSTPTNRPTPSSADISSHAAAPAAPTPVPASRPVLPPDVPEFFLAPDPRASGPITYTPALVGLARIRYTDAKLGIDEDATAAMIVDVTTGPIAVDWAAAELADLDQRDLQRDPAPGAAFAPLPAIAARGRSYDDWRKDFADALSRRHSIDLLRSPALKLTSHPGESPRDFRARLAHALREQRDGAADKLREKYTPRLAALEDRIRRAEQTVAVQKEQASAAKLSTALSFGTAVLGAFLGRKTLSSGNVSRAATAARGVGRAGKEASDVARAEENAESLRSKLAALESEFKAELDDAASQLDGAADALETLTLRPKKTGISVTALVLVWKPITA